MIRSENCYVIVEADGDMLASEYQDILFESLSEAEDFIESECEEPEMYSVISLIDLFEYVEGTY